MPSVIRLLEYRRIPTKPAPLAQKHPAARPQLLPVLRRCAASSELTLDHVIPRSARQFHLENLVACCHACNRRKGNRMLHEIDDMALMRDPRPFSLHTSRQIMRMLGRGTTAGGSICLLGNRE